MRIGALFILILTFAVQSDRHVQAQSPSLQRVMQEKVENTERLLRPVVTADFVLIDRYSERLSRISYTEVSSWYARAEPEYGHRATMFLDAVQRMRRAAVAKDRDNVAASYTALVESCAQCHLYVDRTRSIAFPARRP